MQRPDPDQLLSQLQHAEQHAQRGRLKIFFGACAGVGKTYAMLKAAQQQHAQGQRVLIGVIETHGRQDTEAQVLELPILPKRAHPYAERLLYEFDLDAALHADVDLILVDELAHSNVVGSRHPKRWQDIEELLQHGIDVYTTLNVQHLESLNDIVGQVTGIVVRETLPDHVFDRADDVVLVDLPVDELLERLHAGKVYLADQAARASQAFFRKGNLIALRELALRRTADRVDAQMQDYRHNSRITPLWKTQARLLVILDQPRRGHDPQMLIRHAARLAQQLKTEWRVVLLDQASTQRLDSSARQQWLSALHFAQSLGASTDVLAVTHPVEQLTPYLHQHNIACVVIDRVGRQQRFWHIHWLEGLQQAFPNLDVVSVNSASTDLHTSKLRWWWLAADHTDQRRGDVWAIAGCTAVTVLLAGLTRWFDLANVVMLYLLVVMWVSAKFGRRSGILAAVLSVLSFDFFFVEPKLSFSVSDTQYLLTFAVMLGVALWVNHLAANLRFQAHVAMQREQRANQLTELSQQLSGVLVAEQVDQLAHHHIGHLLDSPIWIARLDPHDQLMPPSCSAEQAGYDDSIADWVYQHQQPAGQGTDTLPATALRYFPLKAPMRTRGIVAVQPRAMLSDPDVARLLDSMLSQLALALERVHFVEVAQQALVKIEGERLRSTLLSALSHDLRTPITVMNSLVHSLAQPQLALSEQQHLQQQLLTHSHNMERLVLNLLDMAKLQSGGIQLRPQWIMLGDVLSHVLRQLATPLAKHHVVIDIAPDFPLMYLDELLLSRVLHNLLENAQKYTPVGSTITIRAHAIADQHLELAVCDNGAGIPAGMEEAIFERFRRGHHESTQTGLGLGLALCREMMRVQGGSLQAEPRQPHGVCFVLRWSQPIPPKPPLDPEE